jgi:hypothetical protein
MLEDPGHLSKEMSCDERPTKVAPPATPVDRLGRKQVKPEVPRWKNPGFDSPRRPDEYRLNTRAALLQGTRYSERGHEVSAGAAAGDQDG